MKYVDVFNVSVLETIYVLWILRYLVKILFVFGAKGVCIRSHVHCSIHISLYHFTNVPLKKVLSRFKIVVLPKRKSWSILKWCKDKVVLSLFCMLYNRRNVIFKFSEDALDLVHIVRSKFCMLHNQVVDHQKHQPIKFSIFLIFFMFLKTIKKLFWKTVGPVFLTICV